MTNLSTLQKEVEELKKNVHVEPRKLVIIRWANGQVVARLWSDGSLVKEDEYERVARKMLER